MIHSVNLLENSSKQLFLGTNAFSSTRKNIFDLSVLKYIE